MSSGDENVRHVVGGGGGVKNRLLCDPQSEFPRMRRRKKGEDNELYIKQKQVYRCATPAVIYPPPDNAFTLQLGFIFPPRAVDTNPPVALALTVGSITGAHQGWYTGTRVLVA